MADDLKRVGLKFTADGVRDFKKELKECSAATKENYSELKLAQSQYDKNTTSAKKLEDRQKYLASQTDVYKDKVSILNSQLKEMESAENRDETAIAKKRAELNEAQAKLNSYEKSLEEVNKQLETHSQKLTQWGKGLQETGGKIKDVGGKISDAGESLTKKITVPVAAAGAASVAAWNEVDNGLDIVIKKTGATGEAAESLKQNVKNLTSSIPTDFETAGNAVGEVNTRFGLTGQELEDLSGKFIKFAELNETDVTSAIDSTQKVMEAWGLNAKGAADYLDVLNKTGQDTGISVDNLSEKLVKNQSAMMDMGLDAVDAVKILGQLEVSGQNTDSVIGGLSKGYKYCSKEGLSFKDTMKELQEKIVSTNGSTESLNECYTIFGKSGDQVFEALRQGAISFDNLTMNADEYNEALGSVENTYDEVLDPLDKTKMAMNDLKVLGADIVETSAPMIEKAIAIVRDVIKDLSDKWSGLTEEQQQSIIKIALVAAAIGPLLVTIGKVVTAVGSITSGIGGLFTKMGSVVTFISGAGGIIPALTSLVTAAAPFLIGGAIIVGIIAAVVLLIKNWDKVKEAVGKVVKGIKDSWNGLVGSAKDLARDAKQAFEDLKTGIKNKVDAAKDFAKKAFDKIKGFAKFVWNLPALGLDAITSIPQKVKDIVDKIKGFFNFTWKLPHIPLPHFAINPSGWQLGDLLQGSIPSLGINWYAKAYDRAAYYTRPTVRADGRGYGDRQGGEFAVGESKLYRVVGDAIRNNTTSENNFTVNITINASEGQDVRELADTVADRIKATYEREGVVWA